MAINPDPALPNRNTLYLGKSGSGKSQALRQNRTIPTKGARVMLWDPARDQNRPGTFYCQDRAEYARHLKAAVLHPGFRLAYDGPRSVEAFEWWCHLAWIIADGNRPLYLLVEELARVCPHAGEATPWHNMVLEEGRKHGIVYHATTQRPQEISKTAFHGVENYWIGRQIDDNARASAKRTGVPLRDLATLEPLQFIVVPGRAGQDFERVTLKYQPH